MLDWGRDYSLEQLNTISNLLKRQHQPSPVRCFLHIHHSYIKLQKQLKNSQQYNYLKNIRRYFLISLRCESFQSNHFKITFHYQQQGQVLSYITTSKNFKFFVLLLTLVQELTRSRGIPQVLVGNWEMSIFRIYQ